MAQYCTILVYQYLGLEVYFFRTDAVASTGWSSCEGMLQLLQRELLRSAVAAARVPSQLLDSQ